MIEKEISIIQHRIHHLRNWHISNGNYSIRPPQTGQAFILEYVKAHPGCSQQDVADCFKLSRATVTKSIKRMISDGLIVRRVSPDDERCYCLYTSEKGKEVTEEIRASFEQTDELSYKGFTDEEKMQFKSYLDRILENLETNYSRGKSSIQLIREMKETNKEEAK